MATEALQGKVVIITGAGRGIGRECALLMAREGACVVVNDLGASLQGEGADQGPAEAVAAEIRAAGGQAIANTADVSQPGSGEALVQVALGAFGRLDAVVNNAGIMRGAPFTQIEPADWDRVLRVNLDGAYHLSRAAVPQFVRQGAGALVHMTSTAALIGTRNHAAYAASKNALAALSRSIALELAGQGVRSNCVAPLAFSRMTTGATGRSDDDPVVQRQRTAESAAAIAPMVAYLVSDAAQAVNGQLVCVRGNEMYLFSQPRPVRMLHQADGWSVDKLGRMLTPAWQSAFTPLEVTREVFTWDAG